jgi:hypothetical protein
MLTKFCCHSLYGGIATTVPRIRFRRWPIVNITTLAVIVLERGTQALSTINDCHERVTSRIFCGGAESTKV